MRHSLVPRLAAAPACGRIDDADQAAAAGLRRGGGQRLPDQERRRNGAMIAGIGTPWGFASGDGNYGYHLVWSRDMYKFATPLSPPETPHPPRAQ